MSKGEMLDHAERTLLVWTILGLALIGCVQVFTRYVLNYSFTWFEELGRYLGVFITFLGAAIGVKSSSHFTMDLFVTKLRHPWRPLLCSATSLLCSSFFLLVAWYSAKIVLRMHGYGTTSPAMGLPMYIAYLPIPLFSTVMALRYCGQGLGMVGELRRGSSGGEA